MKDCLFCTIANDDPRGQLIWQNERVAAFNDVHPKAPVHILVVPKSHVQDVDGLDDRGLAGDLLLAVKEVAARAGIAGAYRVHINNGQAAGQVVPHLHIHLLGKIPADQMDELREDGL